MTVKEIAYICYLAIAFLFGCIPTVIGFCKAFKAKKNAKTTEEKAAANVLLEETAISLIQEAESFYKALDDVLKSSNNGTAGAFKKESVMAKLQAFAIENNITFDVAYWSDKVDKIVALTKKVNSK